MLGSDSRNAMSSAYNARTLVSRSSVSSGLSVDLFSLFVKFTRVLLKLIQCRRNTPKQKRLLRRGQQ